MSRNFLVPGLTNTIKKTFVKFLATPHATPAPPPQGYPHQALPQSLPRLPHKSTSPRDYFNTKGQKAGAYGSVDGSGFTNKTSSSHQTFPVDTAKPKNDATDTVGNLISDGLPSPGDVVRQNSNKTGMGFTNNTNRTATTTASGSGFQQSEPLQMPNTAANPFWLEAPRQCTPEKPMGGPGGKYRSASVKSFANMTGRCSDSV